MNIETIIVSIIVLTAAIYFFRKFFMRSRTSESPCDCCSKESACHTNEITGTKTCPGSIEEPLPKQ